MSNESTNIIETMSAELEHLRPMEASLEMAEADVKAYKQRIAVLEKEIAELKSEIRRKEAVEQRWFEQCMEARSEAIRLKRALWLARAERAEARKNYWYARSCHEGDDFLVSIDGSPVKYIGCIKRTNYDWLLTWSEVESKCRAKAEGYK